MTPKEKSYESPLPKVLLLLAIAAGIWVLIYLGVTSVWPWGTDATAATE